MGAGEVLAGHVEPDAEAWLGLVGGAQTARPAPLAQVGEVTDGAAVSGSPLPTGTRLRSSSTVPPLSMSAIVRYPFCKRQSLRKTR